MIKTNNHLHRLRNEGSSNFLMFLYTRESSESLYLSIYLFTMLSPRFNDQYYYTSDSLWKIWLVESIQSIHNSLWTWHDKCNICCRYCIYHVKFNVCRVTKPVGVFSSETEWLNVFFCLLFKKCITKQFLNSVFAWYHELWKPRVCIICFSLQLRQITQTSVLIIHAQPHPIIV